MGDRELLELAAKAAGLRFDWRPSPAVQEAGRGWVEWNPLTDDGDALRLAVKLRLRVCHYGDVVAAGLWSSDAECEAWTGMTGADPYAATRRDIVCAAASLADSPEGKG
jgi:hypothetical protein